MRIGIHIHQRRDAFDAQISQDTKDKRGNREVPPFSKEPAQTVSNDGEMPIGERHGGVIAEKRNDGNAPSQKCENGKKKKSGERRGGFWRLRLQGWRKEWSAEVVAGRS